MDKVFFDQTFFEYLDYLFTVPCACPLEQAEIDAMLAVYEKAKNKKILAFSLKFEYFPVCNIRLEKDVEDKKKRIKKYFNEMNCVVIDNKNKIIERLEQNNVSFIVTFKTCLYRDLIDGTGIMLGTPKDYVVSLRR